MKLLYVGLDKFNNKYKSLFKTFGVEVMYYTNPLKAIDNFKEIEPDIVYFCKTDFPRLWKIVLTGLRETFNEKKTLFILHGDLNEEETKAFTYLKGNKNIKDEINCISELKELIKKSFNNLFVENTYYPDENELCLGFVKPDDFSFINGQIIKLSEKNFIFESETSEDIMNLTENTIIENASLSYGDSVINLNFRIISINQNMFCEVLEDIKDYKSLSHTLFV